MLARCGGGDPGNITMGCETSFVSAKAGDGIGVGISLIGERHLLLMPLMGISSSMVGGCSIFVEDVDATDEELDELLCAFKTSSTGTSMVVNTGESGGPLDKLTGVCIDDVEDSSSPGASSCGLETVGVVEGDTNTVADKGTVAVAVVLEMVGTVVAKFRNMASIESALDTFARAGEPAAIRPRNGIPPNDS
ncbi:hypothetical protein GQX74_007676 [Glossina fuscipes]|nr:hypothetical protein GQX74_007676 [Glossina fuscipes]